jgi:hypothetical protein
MKWSASDARLGFFALVVLTITACGGGSGGGHSPASGYDLQAAYGALVTAGATTNVNLSGTVTSEGTSVPFTGTGTLTLTAGAATTFANSSALSQQTTLSGTVSAEGQSEPYSANATNYYAPSTYAYLGETASGEYDVATTPITYPDSVVAGSGGNLGTVSRYTDSSMSTATGTSQLSYAVTAAGDALSVTFTTQVFDSMNNLLETDTNTYSLSSSNTLSYVSGTGKSSTGSLSVTAQ